MACDRKIGPFACCSVVQGDCLELIHELPFLAIACVTDPPYGIDYNPSRNYGVNSSKWGKQRPFSKIANDAGRFDPKPLLHFPSLILFGANHYSSRLPDSGGWLVWDKKRGATLARGFIGSDAELIWTNVRGTVGLFQHMWCGLCRDTEVKEHHHPTQKPVALMVWCIEQVSEETIFDPFCGSGSTLVAAAKLGRHFLGFEISPEYCEIARKRIAAVEAQPTLFEPKPIQEELGL